MTRPQRIAVLGGSGFVGRSVCERLVRRKGGAGGAIVVPTRRARQGDCVRALPTLEVIVADLHDDAALRRVLSGCDAVANLIGILHGNAAAFERAHVELPRRLAAACADAGIRRMVHVSALGADVAAPSMYLRSKAAGETVLHAATLDLTVMRPSVIFGAQDHFLNLFAKLQAVLPFVTLAGSEARFQPVWVEDVAEAIVRSLDAPTSSGLTIECTGPEVLTLRELVRLAGQWSGHPRPLLPLPLPRPLGRLQAWLLEWLPGEPLLSRDNLDSMRVANIASGNLPRLAALGIQPASLAQIAPAYLGARTGLTGLDRLRAARPSDS